MNKVLFMKTISGIWSNIFKKTYAPITEKIDKKTFLDGLFNEKFHYVLLKLKDLFNFNESQLKQKIEELRF